MDLPNKQEPPKEVPHKHIKQVVPEGIVVQAPRPMTRRFLDFVFAESPKDIAKRVARDTLVPRAKAGVQEGLFNFINGMLWGNSAPPMQGIVQGTVLRGGNNVYAQASQQPSGLQQAMAANTSRTSGTYEDLTFPTQDYAERTLAQLYEVFNQYRVVCVADLYEMVGIQPGTSDNAYGWMTLDGARISKVREGFRLELPKPRIIA